LVCALHWYEQIAPAFTALFSTAQAPGGSFIVCFIALADADGMLHGMLAANTNASVTTRIFANDVMRIGSPKIPRRNDLSVPRNGRKPSSRVRVAATLG
jgi:hypothetical protein